MAKKKVKETKMRFISRNYNPNETNSFEYSILEIAPTEAAAMLAKRSLIDLCRQFGSLSVLAFVDYSAKILEVNHIGIEFEDWASRILYDPDEYGWFCIGDAVLPRGDQNRRETGIYLSEVVLQETDLFWTLHPRYWDRSVTTERITWEQIEAISDGRNPFADEVKPNTPGLKGGG